MGMTLYNLYASCGLSTMYTWYLISLSYDIPMTVLSCSLIRRILGVTLSSSHLSLLHGVLSTLQFAFGIIGMEDICGPTAKLPFIVSIVLLPVVPLSILSALLLNLRILFYLYLGAIIKKVNEVNYWQKCVYGLLAQTLIPCFFVLPASVGEVAFFINSKIHFPDVFWIVINGLTCIYLSVNPLITIIAVNQYNKIVKQILGISQSPRAALSSNAKQVVPISVIAGPSVCRTINGRTLWPGSVPQNTTRFGAVEQHQVFMRE
ncbi:unnamed protein product [Anisakis simplex]|uniref:G protein-coupled receptor n=1 Tax=Anisakis simplex TaxID=6269 RepID=A0A0M3JSH2_ANISI|nr:unnamed protein product [Anisakis simplex]